MVTRNSACSTGWIRVGMWVVAYLPPLFDGLERCRILAISGRGPSARLLVADEDGVRCWIDRENVYRETYPPRHTEEVPPESLRPGDRVIACFGIVTVRAVETDGARVTLHWQENQPSVTVHPSNWQTRLLD